MAQTDIPDVKAKIGSRDKNVPWYLDSPGDRLGPTSRKLLEEYSHIAADEVESHVSVVREKAWQIWPYPCIGQFAFLDLSITTFPQYSSLLSRLKEQKQTFLDLGCCFGQDLRALAAAEAPGENLYATDLRRDFWELSYELFKDRDRLQSRFIEADALADEPGGLEELDGKIDNIVAGSFLHLFDYAGQFKVCERIVRLMRPVKGSMLLGRQVGCVVAGEKPRRTNHRESMYRHNEESFKRMWDEVGEKTGTKWKVEVELRVLERKVFNTHWDPDMRQLRFAVFRE